MDSTQHHNNRAYQQNNESDRLEIASNGYNLLSNGSAVIISPRSNQNRYSHQQLQQHEIDFQIHNLTSNSDDLVSCTNSNSSTSCSNSNINVSSEDSYSQINYAQAQNGYLLYSSYF
jgi:hypothetical protein